MTLTRLFYEEKGTFFQTLHTVAALGYTFALGVPALLFSHPLYLLGTFLVGVLAVTAAGAAAKWRSCLRFGLWMAATLLVINALVARAGATVVWSFPALPLLGKPEVSLEAVCYGAAMGVRLLAVLTAVCLYSTTVHPARMLGLFSRLGYRSGLVLALATRMLPALARDLARIREVQRMRGVDPATGTAKERLQKGARLLEALLLASLEGSQQTAEALHARAFGSGFRSSYRREAVRPRDVLCLAACVVALGAAVYAQVKGYATYTYYPRLGILVPDAGSLATLGLVLGALLWPVLLHWGWHCCPYLRRRV